MEREIEKAFNSLLGFSSFESELTVTTKCYCCGRETKLKIYVIEVFLNDRLLIGETKALCNECFNDLETILEKTYNLDAVFSFERLEIPKKIKLEMVTSCG